MQTCLKCSHRWDNTDDACPECGSRRISEGNLCKCPECLEFCDIDEINMFGGYCEECGGYN